MSGTLPSREQGKKRVFYEDGVVKYFMTQPAWKEAASPKLVAAKLVAPVEASDDSASSAINTEITGRIDINAAGIIVDRNPGAIYQLIKTNVIPFHKDGRKVYFIAEELREWIKTHPARKRKSKV
jgi:hypothetical protein